MQGAKESPVIVIYLAANSDAQKEERPIAFAAAVGGSNSLPRPERNKPATDDGMDGRPSFLRAQQHGVDADPIRKIKVLLLCIK